MVCNYMGNERWLEVLDSSFKSEFAAATPMPWIIASADATGAPSRPAGQVRSAGGGGFTAGNVTFVTVFEAGYVLVPCYPLCLFFAWTDTWSPMISPRLR